MILHGARAVHLLWAQRPLHETSVGAVIRCPTSLQILLSLSTACKHASMSSTPCSLHSEALRSNVWRHFSSGVPRSGMTTRVCNTSSACSKVGGASEDSSEGTHAAMRMDSAAITGKIDVQCCIVSAFLDVNWTVELDLNRRGEPCLFSIR